MQLPTRQSVLRLVFEIAIESRDGGSPLTEVRHDWRDFSNFGFGVRQVSLLAIEDSEKSM